MNSRILFLALTASLLAAPLSGAQASTLKDFEKLAKTRLAGSAGGAKFSLKRSATGVKSLIRINAAMLKCFLRQDTDKPC